MVIRGLTAVATFAFAIERHYAPAQGNVNGYFAQFDELVDTRAGDDLATFGGWLIGVRYDD